MLQNQKVFYNYVLYFHFPESALQFLGNGQHGSGWGIWVCHCRRNASTSGSGDDCKLFQVSISLLFLCAAFKRRSQKCKKAVKSSVSLCTLGISKCKSCSLNVDEIDPRSQFYHYYLHLSSLNVIHSCYVFYILCFYLFGAVCHSLYQICRKIIHAIKEDAVLKCLAVGQPKPTVEWKIKWDLFKTSF